MNCILPCLTAVPGCAAVDSARSGHAIQSRLGPMNAALYAVYGVLRTTRLLVELLFDLYGGRHMVSFRRASHGGVGCEGHSPPDVLHL